MKKITLLLLVFFAVVIGTPAAAEVGVGYTSDEIMGAKTPFVSVKYEEKKFFIQNNVSVISSSGNNTIISNITDIGYKMNINNNKVFYPFVGVGYGIIDNKNGGGKATALRSIFGITAKINQNVSISYKTGIAYEKKETREKTIRMMGTGYPSFSIIYFF